METSNKDAFNFQEMFQMRDFFRNSLFAILADKVKKGILW